MTIKDVLKAYDGEYAELMVFAPVSAKKKSFHTDECYDVTEYGDNMQVLDAELMNEEEFGHSVLANGEFSADFEDWYNDKNAKVLCVLIDASCIRFTTKRKYTIFKVTMEIGRLENFSEELFLYGDSDPEEIATYDNMAAALSNLRHCKSDARELSGNAGKYFLVTEYYLQSCTLNDEDEYVDDGDIIEYSKFDIEVVENNTYKTLNKFTDVEEALKFKKEYDYKDDAGNGCYLKF